MSKLTIGVEKERIDFIFGVPLTEVVLELNQLIKKYGGDVTLRERYHLVDEDDWYKGTYHCVCAQELGSDDAYEHGRKYYSDVELAELKELKRLKEKYPFDI
jgi:hypothetical protein